MASLKRCGHWKVCKTWFAAPTEHGGYREHCIDCGEQLSLGYSDEKASDAVRVEIRAAEIAASVYEPTDAFIVEDLTACERMGWCGWIDERSIGILSEHAGYLAREIYDHKEPTP